MPIAAMRPMMATTIMISIKVNARRGKLLATAVFILRLKSGFGKSIGKAAAKC